MKPVSQWVENYKGSAPRATSAYTQGVQSTQKSWSQSATNAIPAMVQGFNDAANSGRIAQGIQAAGDGYWKSQTVAKANNYSTGLAVGGDNYGAAAQKLAAALQTGIGSLGQRGPTGSEQNFARSRQLGLYLHSQRGNLGAR